MSTLIKFIVISFTLIAIALSVTVYVWSTIQDTLKENPAATVVGEIMSDVVSDALQDSDDAHAAQEKKNDVEDEKIISTVISKPISVSDVPLSETQKRVAETVGIDLDSFIITPEMAACAEGKMGAERVAEFIAGATPSFLEVTSLVGCIGAE